MEKTIIKQKSSSKKREKDSQGRNNICDKDFIVKSFEETKGEIDRLRTSFNFVSDPKLVESIIYKERDAVARYEYLLRQAREKGIKVGALYIYNNACKKY